MMEIIFDHEEDDDNKDNNKVDEKGGSEVDADYVYFQM